MKTNTTAPSQTQAPSAEVQGPKVETQVATNQPREVVVASLTFSESANASLGSAHWDDIKFFADKLAEFVTAAAKTETKAAAIARKVSKVAPTAVALFRLSIVSYSLSGRTLSKQQMAEIASKLSALESKGGFDNKSIKFGGIILPPLMGEI